MSRSSAPTVLVPATPGVLSALGGLVSDTKNDFIQTVYEMLEPAALASLESTYANLAERAMDWLRKEQGHPGAPQLTYSADIRYAGQSFVIAPKVETRGGDKLVRTTLKDPKGGDVAIAYRLRSSGGGWKIIDIFYKNSISQIATRRADFASVLQKGGTKALIAHLNALAAKAGG